jgi:methylamine dehydrogenase accessory protein MauD
MEWSTVFFVSYAVLWGVVIIQVVLILALARLVGQIMSRHLPMSGARVIDPGPEIGTTVASWEGADLAGRSLSLRFPRSRDLFLLYLAPHCTVCARLLPSARRFFNEIASAADSIWVMTQGVTPEALKAYAQKNGLEGRPGISEDALPGSWRVGGAPFGLWIGADGKVKAKGMVDRREHLESLMLAAELGHPSIESYVAARAEKEEQRREQLAAGEPR